MGEEGEEGEEGGGAFCCDIKFKGVKPILEDFVYPTPPQYSHDKLVLMHVCFLTSSICFWDTFVDCPSLIGLARGMASELSTLNSSCNDS